jgi:hypothetical protein
MDEVARFETEADYLTTAKELRRLIDGGVLQELQPDFDQPIVYRRFLEKSSSEVWVLAVPDHAFRGFLKREGLIGRPLTRV